MPIYPPGNAGSGNGNGFPAYSSYSENNQLVESASVELFAATETRSQRQIFVLNDGPDNLYISYGIPATTDSALYVPEGVSWIDPYDGGMAVNVISAGQSSVRCFVRSEGEIILPEPPPSTLNIEALSPAWVIESPTQPSYQIFKSNEALNHTITVTDPSEIVKNNSFQYVELWACTRSDYKPWTLDVEVGEFPLYVGRIPFDESVYQSNPPGTFEWSDSQNRYFYLITNTGITDYIPRLFSMIVIGNGLLQVVDYQTY